MLKRDDSKTLRYSSWIALLVVATLVLMAGIFAKYTMVSDPATDSARVAKFVLLTDEFKDVALFDTVYDGVTSFDTSVVAPGTSRTVDIEPTVISEVAYRLDWEIKTGTSTDTKNVPIIVKVGNKFYSDYSQFAAGDYYMVLNSDGAAPANDIVGSDISGTAPVIVTISGGLDDIETDFSADFAPTIAAGRDHTETVSWFWPFEVYAGNPAATTVDAQDILDTALGNAAITANNNINLELRVRATQLDSAP